MKKLLAFAFCLLAGPANAFVCGSGIIIPAYIAPPNASFTAIINAKNANPLVPTYVILNPSNGPGGSAQSAYTTVIGQLQSAKIEVLGYVFTSYGGRPLATVEADVDSWVSFYPTIDGIFNDEMSNILTDLSYYQSLNAYEHGKPLGYTVGNPGANTPLAFFTGNAMDNIMISETNGMPSTSIVQNAGVGNRTQKSIIVYNVPFSTGNFNLSKIYNRLVYMSDANDPDPYNAITSYLSTEMAALRRRFCRPVYRLVH
jgi:hypothetical protein